jgi:hypothetical protein
MQRGTAGRAVPASPVAPRAAPSGFRCFAQRPIQRGADRGGRRLPRPCHRRQSRVDFDISRSDPYNVGRAGEGGACLTRVAAKAGRMTSDIAGSNATQREDRGNPRPGTLPGQIPRVPPPGWGVGGRPRRSLPAARCASLPRPNPSGFQGMPPGCHVRFQGLRTQNPTGFIVPVAVSDAGMRGGGRALSDG